MNRQQRVGALLGLPATVVALVGLWSFATNNGGGWVWPPDNVTLAEAIATGNYAEVARQLENGVDPNPPFDVRGGVLGDRPARLTPLQAAVRARNPVLLQMLLDHGAVVGPTGLSVLKCMNDEDGDREVRQILDALPGELVLSCTEVSIP